MELGLQGKFALVTGGSAGIGKAVAKALAQERANVSIVARGTEKLKSAVEEIRAQSSHSKILAVSSDLSTIEGVEHAVRETISSFGRIDILINNAGAAPGDTIETMDEQRFLEGGLNLKLMGYMRCIRAVLPHMRRQGGGKIINVIGNDGTEFPYWEFGASVVNAACLSMVHSLAGQLGRDNIVINAVNPGPVDTGRWDWLVENFAKDWKTTPDEANRLALNSIPLRRLCKPQEVADLVVFLSSEKSNFINGASINIDGGQMKPIMIAPFMG